MSINQYKLRQKFKKYWGNNKHKEIPPAPLVLKEDPTTLFTSAGMQQLVPYLLGEVSPLGRRLYNIQPCFRAQDLEEVGDNRHDTFFEMMGNWSLGDYFKEDQLKWMWDFFTKELGLKPERLYVTVFKGTNAVPKDEESAIIWKKIGINPTKIFYYSAEKNWWSMSGLPEKMSVGDIGGPDSEIFYDFCTQHNPKYGNKCHPNCDCGRFLEIGNSVFIQYRKNKKNQLEELPQKNVDFGGGLERSLMAVNNNTDVFMTDVFSDTIKTIEDITGKKYTQQKYKPLMRIISDHLKAAVFMIVDGVLPANKEQGYVLRRLIRRTIIKMHKLRGQDSTSQVFQNIADNVLKTYDKIYFDRGKDQKIVFPVINEEVNRFSQTLNRGLKEIEKVNQINGKIAFDLYQTFGFPLEITEELFSEKGQVINRQEFLKEFNKHKELSRTASSSMFKGGLADQNQQTIKYHTATHLLHQALFDILGQDVKQSGSNITTERLRFDFYSTKKPLQEDLLKVEIITNNKIKESLPVNFKIMPKNDALKIGAKAFFKHKYPDLVKVYFVGNYSKEFCGGPHVKNTKEIGNINIYKFEKIGSNLYRIYAK